MKSSNRFFIVSAILLFSFSQNAFSQTIYTITLYVDTGNITKENIDEVCSFKIESPNRDPINYTGDLTKFIIHVSARDTIVWRGESTSNPNEDEVHIYSINYYDGDNVFDREVLFASQRPPGIVRGTVKQSAKGFEEKYSINFNVINSGRMQDISFEIDPKISVKP
ncbi:hypothetical protein [Xanthomarina sp.]|uniref:hypothetical protein n=1 Tax=Xanthomarina sp. TaxID=1931211 RepID=UPI002B8A2BF3|nr:hypothetical protein [Xanthomarina sp.]HLV40101.1 hypothetical protein [Xanthomarina sp.]